MDREVQILKGFIKNPDNINSFKEAEEILLMSDNLYRETLHSYQSCKIKNDKGIVSKNTIAFSEVKAYTDEIVSLVKSVIICINSKFNKEVKSRFGNKVSELYTLMGKKDISFSPLLKILIKKESELLNKYFLKINTIKNSEGLTAFEPYFLSKYLEIAKNSSEDIRKNYYKISEIYIELVDVRNRIAQEKGFLNYYDYQMSLQGKDKKEISLFANEMKADFSSFLSSFLEGRDSNLLQNIPPQLFHFYFLNNKDRKDIDRENLEAVFKEVDEELFQMFKKLNSKNKLDSIKSNTKRDIAYTTYLYNDKLPYIFMQDRGGFSDLRVLTHELGHAFEKYLNKDVELFSQFTSDVEIAESQAITMELIFAEEQSVLLKDRNSTDYKNYIVLKNLMLIPEALCIYEFERLVYSSKLLRAEDLRETWFDLNVKFGLVKEDVIDKEQFSNYWIMKKHLFNAPCYYINYAIAKLIAFQFYKQYVNHKKDMFVSFKRYNQSSGFELKKNLLKNHNIHHPFSEESSKVIVEFLQQYFTLYNSEVNGV